MQEFLRHTQSDSSRGPDHQDQSMFRHAQSFSLRRGGVL
jgi:hypothetical protein